MKLRCSLVDDVVMTSMRTVIGCGGFPLWPIAERAFYKLLLVQEVDSPPRGEKTQQGIFKSAQNAWKTKTFGFSSMRTSLLDAQKDVKVALLYFESM